MRATFPYRCLALALLLTGTPAGAQELAATCRVDSSYDLTVQPAALVFDRPSPSPAKVWMHDGQLRLDGTAVSLDPVAQDRLVRFETQTRALLPRLRATARDGVALAAGALRAQVATMSVASTTRAAFEARLASVADELDGRIRRSDSTHDWQGPQATHYLQGLVAELAAPLLQDLAGQAVEAAMQGDLQRAAQLRDTAATLPERFRARLQQRLRALQPQVEALCPAVRRLAALQDEVRLPSGGTLDLLQVDRPGAGQAASGARPD